MKPFILVKVMESIVNSIPSKPTFMTGTAAQVTKLIKDYNNGGEEWKDKKYPLIAMKLPARETLGSGKILVRIDSIVIAHLTNSELDVLDRYNDGGTFKTVLYPLYADFLDAIAFSGVVECLDPLTYKHTKSDNPGVSPKNTGITDYIDSIELTNLEITFNYIENNC